MENKNDWNCAKCSALNFGEDNFCKNCGQDRNSSEVTGAFVKKNKSLAVRVLLIVLVTLVILGGGSGGYYFYYQNKVKKEAKNYLVYEGKAFANYTRLINDLSVEKLENIANTEDSEESTDVSIKKIEDEKGRTEKTLAEIDVIRKKNSEAKKNKLVLGLDQLLKKHYEEASTQVMKYDKVLAYAVASAREEKRIEEEMEKIDKIFKNSKSIESIVQGLNESLKLFEETLVNYRNMEVPEELADVKAKNIKLIEEMSNIFRDFTKAIESKNEEKLNQSMKNLDDFLANEKRFKEIVDLTDLYFKQLHERFLLLRRGAEDIKTEFIKSSYNLEVEVEKIDIEAW